MPAWAFPRAYLKRPEGAVEPVRMNRLALRPANTMNIRCRIPWRTGEH